MRKRCSRDFQGLPWPRRQCCDAKPKNPVALSWISFPCGSGPALPSSAAALPTEGCILRGRTVRCDAVPCHAMLCPCFGVLCDATLHYKERYDATCDVALCYAMLCYARLDAMPGAALLSHVMLRYGIISYVMLCSPMPCGFCWEPMAHRHNNGVASKSDLFLEGLPRQSLYLVRDGISISASAAATATHLRRQLPRISCNQMCSSICGGNCHATPPCHPDLRRRCHATEHPSCTRVPWRPSSASHAAPDM